MKKILIVLIVILSQYTSLAQGFTWAKSFGTNRYHDDEDWMTLDKDGNVYIIGNFATGADVTIRKLDINGNVTWQKQLITLDAVTTMAVHAYTITSDKSGCIYLAGWFTGSIDFDPGTDTFALTTAELEYKAFILKLDGDGKLVWVKHMEGVASDVKSMTLTEDNIYITGYFSGTVDFDPGIDTFKLTTAHLSSYVLKLDSAGNFNWVFSIESDDFIYSRHIYADKAGSLYITGNYEGNADIDPGPGMYNISGKGVFFLKTDSAGTFSWANSNEFRTMAVDDTGNIYVKEYFTPSFKKLDSAGNLIWTKQIMINPCISIAKTGEIFMTGAFDSTRDFDPQTGKYKYTAKGLGDIFIAKLDNSGNFIWAKALGDEGHDLGQAILTDEAGNAYVSGYFSGNIDFDTDTGHYYMATLSFYQLDIFVMKIAYNNVGVEKYEKQNEIIISPNPVKDKLRIQTSSLIKTVIIKDAQGKLIKTVNKPGNEINLSYLPAGVYLLQIETEKEQFVHKFLKE